MNKTCSRCGQWKSVEDFYKHPNGAQGRRGDCKACVLRARKRRYEEDGEVLLARVKTYRTANRDLVNSRQRKSRLDNPERAKARGRAAQLRKYGLTIESFDALFAQQGERCAICQSSDPGRSWTVDHDHITGAVRGVLCWHCNVGLGHFRDDVASLITAADYILAANREAARDAS